MADVTRWLNASTSSRDEEMFAGLYAELHKIARGRMAGERPEQTLDATGLVHEAWLRLEKSAPEEWQNRKHFFGAAAEAMRRILVEAARRRMAAKRGEGEGAPQCTHVRTNERTERSAKYINCLLYTSDAADE